MPISLVTLEPAWLAVGFSAFAAFLAMIVAWRTRPRQDGELTGLRDAVDDLGRGFEVLRLALASEARAGRDEAEARGRSQREEASGILREGFARVDAASGTLEEEVARLVRAMGEGLMRAADQGAAQQKERLDGVAEAIRQLNQRSAEAQEALRITLEGRLDTMRQDNAAKLEEMRRTVDEKLQSTLETRLGASFEIVSKQLEQVHRSVGEMQVLATGVGDLKRVLTNVKTRGTWAEVSLGTLLEQVMAADQFARNVEVRPGSGERVDFAIRLPGGGDGLWLPIDSKFPTEDYERLIEASDRADPAAVEQAIKGLETRLRLEGAKIAQKYVCLPHSTDFAILYLPTEGLYAEVQRRPGLVDELQQRHRITVAGPSVLVAMLNSLRMGFRTLAIQERSGEVWRLLGAVKSEFGKYGEVLDKVQRKLSEASDQIDKVSVRRRAIDRRLRDVEALPGGEADRLLALGPEESDEPQRLEAAE